MMDDPRLNDDIPLKDVIYYCEKLCPNCNDPIISHHPEQIKICHDKLSGYKRGET